MTVMGAAFGLMIAVFAAGQSLAPIDRLRTGEPAMQRYVPAVATASDVEPPPNVSAPPAYRALIETMLQQSPTFRRQCARIAAEGYLTVSITPGGGRGTTAGETRVVRRPDGSRHAEIIIWHQRHLVELIAHEIEHVVEQLDGVDLHARAADRTSGVYENSDNRFETRRAVLIGRRVAREAGGRR